MADKKIIETTEQKRLNDAREAGIPWKKWGPYLSERQWGKVRDAKGKRPVYGGTAKFQEDPHWRDLILFYEYFQGDNGAGLGASHQTGWTGLVAVLLNIYGRVDAKTALVVGRSKLLGQIFKEQVSGEKIASPTNISEAAGVKK